MNAYTKNLRYTFVHKWWVLVACWQEGLYWRGFWHDWHKLLPSEFIPYANFFFRAKPVRDESGYYNPSGTGDPAFDHAFFLHTKRGDHHWQFWCRPEDGGGMTILPMSEGARREMLCDWWGAGRAQLGGKHRGWQTVREWYEKNGGKLQLHPDTRAKVEVDLKERK